MREGGRICAICGICLPEPHYPGERRCEACGGSHRVYMSFFLRRGWFCQFLEADLKTPLPKKLNFRSPDKIILLAEHGAAFSNLETRQAMDHAIAAGRGGVWLELTEEQYRKLKAR